MYRDSGARQWRSVAVALLLAVLTGCDRPDAALRPHVLVVTLDTLRADHVSGYGYGRPTTPALDGLMAEGTAFLQASTPTPTTAPSHSTLFTGVYPFRHGVLKNGLVLGTGYPTLAETLRRHGYLTGAVVSAFPLAARFGLARGFDHYDDEFPLAEASIRAPEWEGIAVAEGFDRRADATTSRALAWLDTAPSSQPVFLWVHYYDSHAPYDPPPAYRRLVRGGTPVDDELGREIVGYDAETRFADDQLARLLAGVDARLDLRRVITVVATDHGEGLMSHGWMEHGIDLYEELVRVALVWRLPGGGSARRVDTPVSLIDVAPTLHGLLELPLDGPQVDGHDLSAVLRGDGSPPPRPIFFQRRLYTTHDQDEWPARGTMFGVRDGRWKYVEGSAEGVRELYDLTTDPREAHNLVTAAPGESAALARTLETWLAGRAVAPEPGAVDPADAARLRALGYVE